MQSRRTRLSAGYHIREEVKRQLDQDLTHYCDPQGILPLREAIARDVGARRGLEIKPDRVVVFAGGKPPIGFCEQAYCDPGAWRRDRSWRGSPNQSVGGLLRT